MKDPDTALELLYLEMDGELNAGERQRLERYVRGDAGAARERRQLERLGDLLAESRVAPRPDLTARVMGSLPAAGWEARHPRAWWVAGLLLIALVGAATVIAGLAAGGMLEGGPLAGAARALGGLLAASLVAGAGLLAASWQGVGTALSGLLQGSPLNWAAFAALVVGVNLLLLRRIRRRRAAERAGTGAARRARK